MLIPGIVTAWLVLGATCLFCIQVTPLPWRRRAPTTGRGGAHRRRRARSAQPPPEQPGGAR